MTDFIIVTPRASENLPERIQTSDILKYRSFDDYAKNGTILVMRDGTQLRVTEAVTDIDDKVGAHW